MTAVSRSRLLLLAVGAALSNSGCWMMLEDHDTYDPPPIGSMPAQQQQQVPVIDPITQPHWPPMGQTSGLTVVARDPDGNLSRLSFEFANQGGRYLAGSYAMVNLSGPELGEGYGTLELIATDTQGKSAVRQLHQLLVDLSPPKITLGETLVRADGELELWVGDAWVLGKVELERDGVILKQELPQGYPETLGQTWDYSLVKFSMAELVPGEGPATITATDAAGNVTTETFSLDLDAEPPTVSIVSPGPGAKLTGKIEVTIEANDPGGGPVFVELSLGGAPAGDATGPNATLGLSTSDFVAGPSKLVAVARDRAGNQSTTTVDVIVE